MRVNFTTRPAHPVRVSDGALQPVRARLHHSRVHTLPYTQGAQVMSHIWQVMLAVLCVPGLAGCHASTSTPTPRAGDEVPRSQAISSSTASQAPSICDTGSCDRPEPATITHRNVLGDLLQPCSTKPLTGWFRDGSCRTDDTDRGVHVVCASVTEDFLAYTGAQGNDLSSPRGSFPGLKQGDRWCLCAARWREAHDAGHAPDVVLEATHSKALDLLDLLTLKARSVR